MKDVVTAARATPRVLVTGFGPFPGAPTNPTLGMLDLLAVEGTAGVDLALAILPVTFAGVADALRAEVAASRPDALLLLGLAVRRRVLSVETLARNVASLARGDANGCVPATPVLVENGPETIRATWPAATVLTALRSEGLAASLSRDAGDYVCNAALYHALHGAMVPLAGFLHVPPTVEAGGSDDSPTTVALANAARLAIGVLADATLSVRSPPRRDGVPP